MSLNTTDRDINKLSPNFKLKVIDFLKEVGDTIFITEGIRSQEKQDYLYSKGRTTKGPIVTWTLNSPHTKGNAIDIAFKGTDLYPSDVHKWKEVGTIANKHGIDWGFDLWGVDKPHFQDNGKPYIIKKNEMNIEKFGENIIRNGFSFPSTVYGIPVRYAKTNSKTLVGKANVKDYLPGCIKDEILIFDKTFNKGQDFMYKVLLHEFSHFIYHRYIKTEYSELINETDFVLTKLEYWERLSNNIKEYISDYASTQAAEDFAELIGYSHYIENNFDLPDNILFSDNIRFKYIIANNLFNTGLDKFLKI